VTGKPITIVIPPDRLGEEPERRPLRDHPETQGWGMAHISLTISPEKDAQGRVIGASKVARDITEHKRQEQAFNRSMPRSRDPMPICSNSLTRPRTPCRPGAIFKAVPAEAE
jgi:hypothetical protein